MTFIQLEAGLFSVLKDRMPHQEDVAVNALDSRLALVIDVHESPAIS